MAAAPPATPSPDDSGAAFVSAPQSSPRSSHSTTVGGGADTHSKRSGGEGAAVFAGGALGRFQIEGVLGRGGMGTVYRAFDPLLERRVALKVPRFDAVSDSELRRRFLAEARAAAAVSHPNLVEVYEAGTTGEPGAPDRRCYIASKLCDGPDLARWLEGRSEPPAPAFAAALVRALADAVHRCHLAGVVHRDLKPANVLLDAPDAPAAPASASADPAALPFVPKVSDFGVARVLEESAAATSASRVVGTPLYMAPEQAAERMDEIGPASDVWALGAILYELLTGRPPFDGTTMLALLRQIAADDPPPPRDRRPGMPAGLDAVCMKCLRKRPEDRYRTAADLAADLDAWAAGRAVTARPFGWRERAAGWLRRPERLRDAGAFAMLWDGTFTAAFAAAALAAWQGWDTALPDDETVLSETLAASVSCAVLTFVAYRMLRGDRWAWWVCFLEAVAAWAYVISGWVTGGGAGLTVYEQVPGAKYVMMLTLTAGLTVQMIAILLSIRARPAA